MKIKSLHIHKYKVLEDFNIDFSIGDIVNPVTVICGVNGSGKTTLLDFINLIITNGEEGIENSGILGKDIIDIREIEIPWKDEKTKYSITNPLIRLLAANYASNLIYYKVNDEYFDLDDSIVSYVDQLIYEEDTKSSQAYKKTRDRIKDILEKLDLEIEFDSLNKDKEVYFRNSNKDKLEIYDLSTGEREIITKLLPLYLSNIKNSIILIDEPETSLHPNWQNCIVDLYENIAIKNNLQIIITTHSPYIAGSVKSECLKVLIKENGKIRVIDNNTLSYGKRIDEILLEVFGAKGLRTPAVENKIDRLQQMLLDNEQNESEFEKLLVEMEDVLGRNDRDLTLIRLEKLRLSRDK